MSSQTKIEITVNKEFEADHINANLSVNGSQVFVSNHKLDEFSFKKMFNNVIDNESVLETLENNFKLAQIKDIKRRDPKTTITWDGEAVENQVAQIELNIFKRQGSKYVEAQVYIGGKLMPLISHQDSVVTGTDGIFKNIGNTKAIIDLVNKIVLSPENNERLWKINNPPVPPTPFQSNDLTEQGVIRLASKNDDGSKDVGVLGAIAGKKDIAFNNVKKTIEEKYDPKAIGAAIGQAINVVNKNPHPKFITAHEFLKINFTQEGYNKLRAEGILAHLDEYELIYGLNNKEKNFKYAGISEIQKRISGPVENIINTHSIGMKDCRTKLQRKQDDLEKELKQLQSECESLQFQTLSDFEKADIIEAINITQQLIVVNLRRINRETK